MREDVRIRKVRLERSEIEIALLRVRIVAIVAVHLEEGGRLGSGEDRCRESEQ